MELPISGPTNRFLVRERDHRWPHALTAVLLAAGALLLMLALVGWPRLKCTSVNYDLIRLRSEVRELHHQERRLAADLERRRNPMTLAHRAHELGLQPPSVLGNETAAPGGGG